jgi:hypothetical protein
VLLLLVTLAVAVGQGKAVRLVDLLMEHLAGQLQLQLS